MPEETSPTEAPPRFGYNDPPNDHISRDPPLVLQTAPEETPVATVATVAVTAPVAATSATPAFPFSYDSSSNLVNAQHAAARRNMAQISSGPVEPIPPLRNANVPVSPTPAPGTAPVEIQATLGGSGDLFAAADLVVRAEIYRRGLAANTIENRRAAQALLEATQAAIDELRDKRLNDPDTGELIDFLDWLAMGLSELVEILDRAIADPASEPMFLGTAGEIARQLKLGLMEAVEKNRVRIWEVGACVGTASFLSWLSGESLAQLMSTLFGAKK